MINHIYIHISEFFKKFNSTIGFHVGEEEKVKL